jgi:ATP-dependent protease ClpP protease subunit
MAKKPPASRLRERVDTLHENWIDLEKREIWIQSSDNKLDPEDGDNPGIEYSMATKVIKNLHILRHQSATLPVVIHMNSVGGEESQGLAIYDTIRAMPYHTTIIAYSHAESMSSYVLQAARKRLMMPSAYFMMHCGSISLGGHFKSVYSQLDFYKKQVDELLMDIYLNRAVKGKKFEGWEKDKIREFFEAQMNKQGDVFLSAMDAVYWGLADDILSVWPHSGGK